MERAFVACRSMSHEKANQMRPLQVFCDAKAAQKILPGGGRTRKGLSGWIARAMETIFHKKLFIFVVERESIFQEVFFILHRKKYSGRI